MKNERLYVYTNSGVKRIFCMNRFFVINLIVVGFRINHFFLIFYACLNQISVSNQIARKKFEFTPIPRGQWILVVFTLLYVIPAV